ASSGRFIHGGCPYRMRTCVPCCCIRRSFGPFAPGRIARPQAVAAGAEVVDSNRMAQLPAAAPTAPVPPQNLDAEESVLGAMTLAPGAIGAVSEVLSASDFYRESHAKIYKAALDLYAKGEPVDAITLADELERRGELEEIGGRARINELAALVPASSNA